MAGYTLKLDLSKAQLRTLKKLLADDITRAQGEGTADGAFPVAVALIHSGLSTYDSGTIKLNLSEYEQRALRVILVSAMERAERDHAGDSPTARIVGGILAMVDSYRAAVAAVKAMT